MILPAGYCHHDFFRCCRTARSSGLTTSAVRSCCQARWERERLTVCPANILHHSGRTSVLLSWLRNPGGPEWGNTENNCTASLSLSDLPKLKCNFPFPLYPYPSSSGLMNKHFCFNLNIEFFLPSCKKYPSRQWVNTILQELCWNFYGVLLLCTHIIYIIISDIICIWMYNKVISQNVDSMPSCVT